MKKHLRRWKKLPFFKKLLILSFFLLILLLPITLVTFSQKTQTQSQAATEDLASLNNPVEKLIYNGLERPTDQTCAGGFEFKKAKIIGGKKLCTPGPEAISKLRKKTSEIIPLKETETNSSNKTSTEIYYGGFGARFFCYGDGKSGNRVQVLYVRSSDTTDEFKELQNRIKMWAAFQTNIYRASAIETGEERYIRFVHDGNCLPIVDHVTISPEGDDNFDNMIVELDEKGYNREDRKYMIFSNANIYCGIGTIENDDRSDLDNWNNYGPSYGRTDYDCWYIDESGWFYTVTSHELMHNLGGVQLSVPHTSRGWHCVDEYDEMCYSDKPYFPPMQYLCPNQSDFNLDCHHDDYYSTRVYLGDYLFSHWNTANSSFLMNNPTKFTNIAGPLRINIKIKGTNNPYPNQLTIRELFSSDCSFCNASCSNFVCNPQRDKIYNPSLGYAQWDYYTRDVKYTFGILNLPSSWAISNNGCGARNPWEPGRYGDECTIEIEQKPTKTNIAGFVWHEDESDPNGVKNLSEPLTANIQISLYKLNAQGTPKLFKQFVTTNDNEANYQFKKLDTGKYTLSINRTDAQNQGLDLNNCNKITDPVRFPTGNNKYLYCLKKQKLILKKWDQNSKTLREVTGNYLSVDGKLSELRVDFPLVNK